MADDARPRPPRSFGDVPAWAGVVARHVPNERDSSRARRQRELEEREPRRQEAAAAAVAFWDPGAA